MLKQGMQITPITKGVAVCVNERTWKRGIYIKTPLIMNFVESIS